jgi:outer membrane protein assembly factor BamB
MRKGGPDGTGRQLHETVLTPAGLKSGKFGQVWPAKSLDGSIWGQPLYMSGIMFGNTAHNVVYVTTDNDSVYAFDADTGASLWPNGKKSLLPTGATAVPAADLQISSRTGILSTPVIDPVRQVIYVVAATKEPDAANQYPHRLYELSLTTGAVIMQSQPITHANLPAMMKFQRPGLLLANNMVYVAFGSVEDRTPYHGLLFAFDAVTLAQNAVFDVAPTLGSGGIWMSGAAPAADENGNIYISTGNMGYSKSRGSNDFGESIVKLSPMLQELDHFTPFDYQTLDESDYDLGSGSLLLVPGMNGGYREVIACGKPKPIYVLNRDTLGGVGTTQDNILQRIPNQLGSSLPCFNSPAMWQQNVYFAANHDVLKMFVLNASTGMLSTTPVSKDTFTYNYPGADPVVSANGNINGIVWTIGFDANKVPTLRANDATDVSKELWVSPSLTSAVRFVPPTVINGHVYVGASNRLLAFGMTQ